MYDHPNNVFVAGFIGSPAMNLLEEKLTDQMHARLAVLDAMKSITPDERTKVAARIADAATAPPPQYEGMDAVVGGPFSDCFDVSRSGWISLTV